MAKKKKAPPAASAKKKRSPSHMPQKLGECIDQLYKWEDEIREKTKKFNATLVPTLDAIKMMREHILENFGQQEIDGATGKISKAVATPITVPNVVDWDAVYGFIQKHKAYDLLHKRVSTEAWRARLEKKVLVPGIKAVPITNLSVKKR